MLCGAGRQRHFLDQAEALQEGVCPGAPSRAAGAESDSRPAGCGADDAHEVLQL